MEVALRAKFLRMAHEIQGEYLPVHFREQPTPNMRLLAPAFVWWAKRAHMHARLALLTYRLSEVEQWLKRTNTNSATA